MAIRDPEFVNRALENHGKRLDNLLRQTISQRRLKQKGKLLSSISHSVSSPGNPSLKYSFYGYGRAIEIKWHKMKHNRNAYRQRGEESVFNIREKRKRRKNTNWYSRNVYGSVNRLWSEISFGYIDHEADKLKDSLNIKKVKI